MTKPVESAPKLNLLKSMSLLDDAQRLTPGGVGGIRRPYNFVVGEYPVFITHGHGGHIIDVDGNEYIDMLCAYGPIILGYVEDEINDAAGREPLGVVEQAHRLEQVELGCAFHRSGHGGSFQRSRARDRGVVRAGSSACRGPSPAHRDEEEEASGRRHSASAPAGDGPSRSVSESAAIGTPPAATIISPRRGVKAPAPAM